MNTSQFIAFIASVTTRVSSVSPNQTTPGRINPSQYGQRGGSSLNVVRLSTQRFGDLSQPCQQLTSQIDPCRRIVSRVSALSCRPSTFCVINRKFGKRLLQSASTRCAGFGSHVAMRKRRHAYHSHTRLGSRPNASAVASASGRKFFQSPSAPRNVGTPLAAETPAPVRTVMRASGFRRATSSFTTGESLPDYFLLLLRAGGNTLSLRGHEIERLGQVGHDHVGVA